MIRLDSVAVRDRFDFWWTMVADTVVPVHADSPYRSRFWAEMAVAGLGPLQLSQVRCASFEARRTARLVRRSDPEVFHLSVTLSGRSELVQHGVETSLRPARPAAGLIVTVLAAILQSRDQHSDS